MRKGILRSALAVAVLGVLLVGATVGQAGPPADRFAKAIAAQERNTARLLARGDVVGTAVGLDARNEFAVVILAKSARATGLPASLDGVPVIVKVTGPLKALHHKPGHDKGNGNEPPPEEPPPPGGGTGVDIGTSAGNANECSSGTLGVRLKASGQVYALSNNHVFARENAALQGEAIVAPGLFDTSCNPSTQIGTLNSYVPINFSGGNNTVDAAIASTTTGQVGKSTPSDGYGTPKSATMVATVGMDAQKYGRTTGHTKGTITAVNATVNVGYGGGTARFVNQIIWEGRKPVIKAGDSGSLLVTDPGKNPVGLLFAGNGNGKLAVANRIQDVLNAFPGKSIDGEG